MPPEHYNPVIEINKQCYRCKRKYDSRWCPRCLNDFITRSRYVRGKAAAMELVEWKKAEIPLPLMVRRASELAGRSVRPSELIIAERFRRVLQAVEKRR